MIRTPAVFISHGSPMVLLADDDYTDALTRLPKSWPRPDAVVVISAHWQIPLPIRVTSSERPVQIYDFGGFPEALYQVKYPASGAPVLAAEIVRMLSATGLRAVADKERGLDHGVWVPLRFCFPDANVPVVAVSLPMEMPPAELVRMGKALAPLRGRNVLLVGSGGVVHNLRRLAWQDSHAPVDPWANEFDEWVIERVRAHDIEGLLAYRSTAPHADLAVPTTEHFDPLFVVLGSTAAGERVVDIHEGFRHGNLSMRSFLSTP
jgi:4,5-DOPA dioxygenase extradiol